MGGSDPRLERLRAKLDPASTALILVDVQNDFCTVGGVMEREGADLSAVGPAMAKLGELLQAARTAGACVIHVRNAYNTPDGRFLSEPFLDVATRRLAGRALTTVPLCEPGTWGADAMPGFEPAADEPLVVKHRYSGFHQTDLEMLLRVRGIRTVITCGVATNVCVESTARDAFMRDFHVVFPSDASATYYDAAHTSTLATIGLHFGEIVTTDEVVGLWGSPAAADAQPTTPEVARDG